MAIHLILEMSHSIQFEAMANARSVTMDPAVTPALNNIQIDPFFVAQVPRVFTRSLPEMNAPDIQYDMGANVEFSFTPEESTYIIRGAVANEEELNRLEHEVAQNAQIIGLYADVEIQPQLVCPGSAPVGTHQDVARLLCTTKMARRGMNGSGVRVAIVDTGINIAHLNARGVTPNVDVANSWYPGAGNPFNAAVGHGTMCAFDVCIAAPNCTLIDIGLLQSTAPGGFSGFLSDAVRAYDHLMRLMAQPARPGVNNSLVVNNSWGMFHPSWDFPVGHPGNYSNNPNHPFNRIVAALERAGADILFAAGNCGPECPDGRCQGVTNAGIYGANSSPAVLSVAGIATNGDRVGYSNRGPGLLSNRKPDITGYTHFRGSGVYSADGGTSAACPVVAGVVAALRTLRPLGSAPSTRPAAIRNLIMSTAKDIGTAGWDYFYGAGLVDACKLVDSLTPRLVNICERFPQICKFRRDYRRFESLCERYPEICRRVNPKDLDRYLDRMPRAIPSSVPEQSVEAGGDGGFFDEVENLVSEEDLNFLEGFLTALDSSGPAGQKQKEPYLSEEQPARRPEKEVYESFNDHKME